MKQNIVVLVGRRCKQGIAAAVLLSIPVLAFAWLFPGLALAGSGGFSTPDLTFNAPAATLAKAGTTNQADAMFLAEHWAYTSNRTEQAEDLVGPVQPGEDESLETRGDNTSFTVSSRSDLNTTLAQDLKNFRLDLKAERDAFKAFQAANRGIISNSDLADQKKIFGARHSQVLATILNIQKVVRAQFHFGLRTFSHTY